MDIKECVSTEFYIKCEESTENNTYLLTKGIEWLKEDVLLSYLSLKKNDLSVVKENSFANRNSNIIIRSDEDSSKEKCSGDKRLQTSVVKDGANLKNFQFTGNVSFKLSNSSEKCYEQLLSVGHLERHDLSHVVGKKFVCDICHNSFETAILLSRHKKTHNKEKTFICEICGKQFARKQHLDNHKFHHTLSCFRKQVDQNKDKSSGNIQRFDKAEKISKKLLSKQHSGDHVPTYNKESYSCDECHKKFAKVEYLNNHKLFYHIRSCFHKQLGDQSKESSNSENSYNCRCCHKKFPLKDLSEHQFFCAECHAKYGKTGRLSSHKSTPHTESCFYRQDKLCEKNINNNESHGNSGLSKNFSSTSPIHLNTKFSGEKEFSCDECHRKFAKEDHLSSHKLYFHVQSCFHKQVGLYKEQPPLNLCDKSYKCMQCHQDFFSKQELLHHQVTCNIKKQYVCDMCNVGFEKQRYLDNHKLFSHAQTCFKNQEGSVHRKVTADNGTFYSCNSCQKKFVLKEHYQSHLLKCGNKEFACDICNVRFAIKVHLTNHKLFRHKSSCFSK